MRIIVTGANGFVGSHLLALLEERRIDSVAVVRSEESDISRIKDFKHTHIVYCPMEKIGKLASLIPDRDIDACVHLAWSGANGKARGDYGLQLANVKWSLDLCRALQEMKVRRFVGIGSLAENDIAAYIDGDGATPNAVSCYGIAKTTAGHFTKVFCTQAGIEYIWCKLANLYGPGDSTNNFINFASKIMLSGGRAAFTEGRQMHDFVYIDDIVRGILAVIESGKTNTGYYLGSGKARQLKEYIYAIREAINPDIELHLGEIPYNGVFLPKEEFDCQKLFEDTGYLPEVPFEDGVLKTLAWLKSGWRG